MTTQTENWMPVYGLEEFYAVSNLGRVKHLPRRIRFVSKTGNESWRFTNEKVLTPNKTREGYLIYHFSVDGIRSAESAHALVAHAFICPRPQGMDVNHINGNKEDNTLLNLEYVTRTENHQHAVRLGLNKQAVRVGQFAYGVVVGIHPSITAAAKAVGVTFGSIKYALTKGTLSQGCTWRYL